MNARLVAALFVGISATFAGIASADVQPTLYCKPDCGSALLEVETENACFVGARGEIIELLNDLVDRGEFEGTDGEYIERAHFKGRSEISYTIVDEKNDEKNKSTLKKCTKDFFKSLGRRYQTLTF